MKKRLAAAAIAALIGFVFLFGQGPVQKVRLWDTNLSHSLLFNWNENDTAGRTLNFLVAAGTRSFTISGDSYIDQDVRIAATPYHAGLYLSSSSVAPFLKLSNASGTARDPIIQYAVGVTPVTRWTHGLDDSLSNDWLLCTGDILTDVVEEETYELSYSYDTFFLVADSGNYRIQKWLTADGSYLAKIGTNGSSDDQFNQPWGICSDGTWVYVTDTTNDRIKKHLLSDLSFVAKIGSHGSGNDNFNSPRGICTDGTWLYIVDKNNNRVVKRLCSDLSYVSETAGPGFLAPDYICTDGTHIYTVQTPGATYRIFKHSCDDLSLDTRVMPAGTDGHIDSATLTAICTTGGYLYLTNSNSFGGSAAVYKYACSDLTWISQFGTNGSGEGHTEVYVPGGITTDGTYLYISDSQTTNYARILQWQLDGTFISHFGVYGNTDGTINGPRGISLSGQITRSTLLPRRGPILRAKADGLACESYVSFQLRDEIQFREDSVANANYIAIQAPATVTSYKLILPGATAGAKKNLQVGATDILAWTQNVDTDGTPSFDHLHLSATSNQIILQSTGVTGTITATPASSNKVWTLQNITGTIYQTAGTDVAVADGGTNKSAWTLYAIPYASATTTIGEIAIGDAGKVLAVAAGATGYEWIAAGGGGTFLSLTDVDEANYTGHAGHFVVVDGDEDALVFSASSVAAHDILSVTHGDTTAAAVTRGAMIAGLGASPKWTAVVAGTEGYVWTMGADEPEWAESSSGSPGMVTLLNEAFDGLATAAISGQGSYTYFGAWAVTLVGTSTATVAVKSGADKMGILTGDTVTEGSSYVYLTTGAAWPWGLCYGTRFHFKMRTSNVTIGTKGWNLGSDSDVDECQVYFRTTGSKITFWNGSTNTDMMTAVNDTWYTIDVFINDGTTIPYALVFIDGVQQAGPKSCGANTENWNQVGFYCNTTGTAAAINLDFDDFYIATSRFFDLVD